MKFVHIADLHFDKSFVKLSDKNILGDLRRLEQRKALKKVIEYIKQNKIKYLFISGDLYENKYIRQSTIEYINNLFSEIPETKIYIAPGNHDPYIKNSYYKKFNWNQNVKIFEPQIEKIETEEANIYGYGFGNFYCTNCGIENLKLENNDKINILVIHGTLDGASLEEKQYNSISSKMLKEKGFDYIALGHIHKLNYNTEPNQKIVNPGSLISLGFDELGKHGMIVGELTKNEINLEFIPIDEEEFKEIKIDVTEIISKEELIEKLNNLEIKNNEYIKIILVGNRNFEIDEYEIIKYMQNERIIKIKNQTKIAIDLKKISNENTLTGIFAKEMLEKLKQENITRRRKRNNRKSNRDRTRSTKIKEKIFLKINKLQVNSYGKLKNKQIELGDHINIIYGQNESGKSTLLQFIINCFYGASKTKNGKEISDLEKYTPWVGEEFSGKLKYELDNKQKFEIFREFKKKNPQIFNEKKEDISQQFNIDKTKGNEFFYEQTKIDEQLFLSTIVANQDKVKLEKQNQNFLIQKVANLVGTGEDNVSFKRAIDRIDRRKLDEIGTKKTREKPINLIYQEIEKLEKEKQEIEKTVDIKYEIEENRQNLKREISQLENENQLLKDIKIIDENEKIESEKINLKINLKNENNEKINLLKNKIDEIKIENKNIFEENKKIKSEKNKLNKKIIILFLLIIGINILQFIFIPNKIFNYIFLLTVPMVLIFYIFLKIKIKNKETNNKNNLEKINSEINNLNYEINLIEKNKKELEKEINELKNNYILKINLEKEKIKNKYQNKIEKNKINNLINIKNNNYEIQKTENELNNKKIELHKLELDYKNIEPKLEKLSNIEEKLVNNNEKMLTLNKLEASMNLAKEVLSQSYEKIKNTVTPKFTKTLSNSIENITNGKYTNVVLNDEVGLIIETENGNYMPISRLSIGTIDQLYLSLRLAMVEDLSEEKMPIILDETFAYFDNERLKNILKYLEKRFSNYQIIIFTCTNREKEILGKLEIPFNFIEM